MAVRKINEEISKRKYAFTAVSFDIKWLRDLGYNPELVNRELNKVFDKLFVKYGIEKISDCNFENLDWSYIGDDESK